MTVPQEISRSKYVSLTTFRKDGTPVATPVWQVTHGDEIFVVTEAASWKVKRVRNNGSVRVTPCNVRGVSPAGAVTVPGTARVIDDAEGISRVRALVAEKYVTSRLGNGLARLLRIKRPPMVGIAVAFT
ncbi:PPOX class F420-dependent oxidoreductase [Virgisporangium aliadipatigenens]|uniref:PPOX class F420-dependent oxidoreductase n=1 Tax=Virgisporangium aliadipatigenens TaxID=741659 RepID=A0A8J4DNP9_9ACTN|nr:PPOX class F420-dependent oxidoreductase [Virgisporangium aliadipatigenens]GIJ43813.1 PPOX class F420-dependent oxidoreductase [Virgisporangium aliadipatigenens]